MSRISYSFRSFFSILFSGTLPPDIAQAYGYSKGIAVRATPSAPAPAPAKPQSGPADGAVQILSILQRDARLIDFLMEDIGGYSDEQVGAAVRDVQQQSRDSLTRYLKLTPVIDAVEDTFIKAEALESSQVKFIGNVPASGKPVGGTLRHKGWKAEKVDLPSAPPGKVLAPAELEIE